MRPTDGTSTPMRTAADALADAVARLGATDIWALGAAKVADILAAARRHPGLRVRGASTEKDAVFAADGASRIHGVGVACFIGSVGLTSAAVGVQTLVLEQRPVLLLVGQSDLHEPPGSLQDTRLSDAAVLSALGCAAWAVHRPEDLPLAWVGAVAALDRSQPAALLIDESALRGVWAGHLPVARQPLPNGSSEQPVDAPPCALTRSAIWQALQHADSRAPKFADAGQARQTLAGLPFSAAIHQCPRSASLGWAVPAAMGAADDGRCYAVCGDGGFMMSLAAAATIGHLNLPVTTIIATNGILGVDSARTAPVPQDLRVPAVDLLGAAEAMGLRATLVDSALDIVRQCQDQHGPHVIVAPVPAFEPLPQTLS